MKIYIPSRGRADLLTTTRSMPDQWKRRTTIVVNADEVARYRSKNFGVEVVASPVRGIANTRLWILENCDDDHCYQIDDDHEFTKRDSAGKFNLLEPAEWDEMFNMLIGWYRAGVAMANISDARIAALNRTKDYVDSTRMYGNFSMNRSVMLSSVKFCRIDFMEDFDYILQLLKQGHTCRSSYRFSTRRAPSNSEGGCSVEGRTLAAQAKAARQLEALHPNLVSTRKVTPKGDAWNGETRTDVRVSWKKAEKVGRRFHLGLSKLG